MIAYTPGPHDTVRDLLVAIFERAADDRSHPARGAVSQEAREFLTDPNPVGACQRYLRLLADVDPGVADVIGDICDDLGATGIL